MEKRSPETPFHYFTHEKNNSPKKLFHSVSLMNKKICRKKVVFFPLSFSNKKKSLHPKHMKKVILLNSPLKNPEIVFTPFLA